MVRNSSEIDKPNFCPYCGERTESINAEINYCVHCRKKVPHDVKLVQPEISRGKLFVQELFVIGIYLMTNALGLYAFIGAQKANTPGGFLG